ncbi:MAG: hypothetical protein NTW90_05420 [Nitrosospira sp.]|nr:hypothetical protein [Nitrosospira sp.]
MSESLARPDKPCGLLRTSAAWTVAMLLGVSMTGCGLLKPAPRPAAAASTPTAPAPVASTPTIATPAATAAADPCAAQQREIERLQQLLAEKEALIRSQQIRQREPAKTSQESATQPSRVRVELRRLPAQ